jgi:hypothetical protein
MKFLAVFKGRHIHGADICEGDTKREARAALTESNLVLYTDEEVREGAVKNLNLGAVVEEFLAQSDDKSDKSEDKSVKKAAQ